VDDNSCPFPQRLSQALKVRKLKQSELASKLEVKPQTVNNWLSGQSLPEARTLVEVAKILEVSLDWLLGLEGPSGQAETDLEELRLKLLEASVIAERLANDPGRRTKPPGPET